MLSSLKSQPQPQPLTHFSILYHDCISSFCLRQGNKQWPKTYRVPTPAELSFLHVCNVAFETSLHFCRMIISSIWLLLLKVSHYISTVLLFVHILLQKTYTKILLSVLTYMCSRRTINDLTLIYNFTLNINWLKERYYVVYNGTHL